MEDTVWHIESYESNREQEAIFELWEQTVAGLWLISADTFWRVLTAPRTHHFIARADGKIIGFVGTLLSERDGQQLGHISLLLVAPERQRQGIGTALHEAALNHLRQAGVQGLQVGGGGARFWPGIPYNLPSAIAFFEKQGWQSTISVCDMLQDLSTYTTAPAIWQRVERERIRLAPASAQDVEAVLAFEKREFLGWLEPFKAVADFGDYQDLMVAWDEDGSIIGTLIMSSPQSHPHRPERLWQQILGQDMGTIGAVGVAESARGRGAGIALVAQASEVLKQRRVGQCSIDWLVIVDFYGKLGYKVWKEYYMYFRKA
jgi:GNAT superfamily N-acetyltransferase